MYEKEGKEQPLMSDFILTSLEKLAVGGHNVAELEVDDVPRNEEASVHVLPPALPLDGTPGSEGGLESGNGIASVLRRASGE
jgi:hypothetical protein